MKKPGLTDILGILCSVGTIGLALLSAMVDNRKMREAVSAEVQAQLTAMNK